jgi:integrase
MAAPTRLTLGEWLDRWLAMREPEIRPTTLRTYRDALRPLNSALGSVRLDRLTPAQVASALATMRRQGLGSRRVQQTYTVANNAIRSAVRLKITSLNPMSGVDRPRHQERQRDYWSMEQVSAFLDAARADGSRYAPLFTFLVTTGLRISETLALRWCDLDWQAASIRVDRALVYCGNRAIMQTPKSRDGRRVIALPRLAVDALKSLPRPLDPETPIFVTRTGTTPRSVDLHRSLQALCRRHELPAISPHGLRHVNAALLAASGVDPHTLRRHLGHSTIQMSLQRYAYAMRPDSAAAAAFDRALLPPGREEEVR